MLFVVVIKLIINIKTLSQLPPRNMGNMASPAELNTTKYEEKVREPGLNKYILGRQRTSNRYNANTRELLPLGLTAAGAPTSLGFTLLGSPSLPPVPKSLLAALALPLTVTAQ